MWSCYCSAPLVSACEGHKVCAQLRHMTASASDPYGRPAGGDPGAGQAGHQGHHLVLSAVASSPHGRAIATLPGRAIHVVADSAYAGGELKKLPARVTLTTRLRKDAALYGLRLAGPAGADPAIGRPAPLPGQTRHHHGIRAGHRHPLRQDRRDQGRRRHMPVALGLRAPDRSPSCSSAPSPRPAMTWPWSPQTLPHQSRRSSSRT